MRSYCYVAAMLLALPFLPGCAKKSTPVSKSSGNPDTMVVPGVDPPTAGTIGFFMNDWQAKTFTAPVYKDTIAPTTAGDTVTVNTGSIITKIPRSLFGQNAAWWMTSMVNQPLFLTQTTNLTPHIIRFPGGSSSDGYFWNEPQGVFPQDAPDTLLDLNGNYLFAANEYTYGETNLNYEATLDDYYSMLQTTNNQGIITVNYAYARYGTSANPVAAAAHLAADWVRYDNGRTQYWEIGNENYGDWELGYRIDQTKNQDGQPEYITGALYAQHFQVFVDSMQQAASEIGKTIYIGAVTYNTAPQSYDVPATQTWNSGMMTGINNKADFYVVHNYFTPYDANTDAADILSDATSVPSQMMSYVTQTLKSNGATVKPIAMDEWNMQAEGSMQMVSNVSGVFADLVWGESIKNNYGMACRWDLENGWAGGNDMGLYSAGDEPGIPQWNPRPSYYYMYFFEKVLGDRLVSSTSNNAGVFAYASTFTSGQVGLTMVNTNTTAQSVYVKIQNFNPGANYYWYSLQGGTDNGQFSRLVYVNGQGSTLAAGGPTNYTSLVAYAAPTSGGIYVMVPALGAVSMVVDSK